MKQKLLLGIFILLKINSAFAQNLFFEVKSGLSYIQQDGQYASHITKQSYQMPLDFNIGIGSKKVQLGFEVVSQLLPEKYVYRDEFNTPRATEEFNNQIIGGFIRYSSLRNINQKSNFILKGGIGRINFSKDVKVYDTNNLNSTLAGSPSLIYNLETGISIYLFSSTRLFIGGQINYYNQKIPIADGLDITDDVTSFSLKTGLSYNLNF